MLTLLLSSIVASAAPAPASVSVPRAPERPHTYSLHGDNRQDPWSWLSNRKDPETIKYLKAENAYADRVMAPTAGERAGLIREMRSHLKESDEGYPVRDGDYLYNWRIKKGDDYAIYFRAPVTKPKNETILLNENYLAKGHDYMHVGSREVSDDGNLFAYSVDLKGDRRYTVYIKDLRTGKVLADHIMDVGGDVVWAADNKTLFYVVDDPVSLRARWIRRHTLGESKDVDVYEEKVEQFDTGLARSLTKKFIFITNGSKTTSEIWSIDAAKPEVPPVRFAARLPGIQYWVEDGGDRFYVRTNRDAENFHLMEAPYGKTESAGWKESAPYKPSEFLERILILKDAVVMQKRIDGLKRLEIRDRKSNESKWVEQKESDYNLDLGENREFAAEFIRLSYTSLTTPYSTIDYDLKTGQQTTRKVQEVPGGFKAENYEAKRIYATADDGTKIPISLVYRKGLRKGAESPLLLYGYGSYGASEESEFDSNLLPLLDRGFIFADAHVRGGSDLGRAWYLNGKLMKKKNTFSDFIACADHLVKENWTSPTHLYAKGASAGGLLMGAVANMRPGLFHGIIANVPFTDVMTTMLDSSLPLTTQEYEEWGNPNEKPAYDYMRSYSPYDNVKSQAYPNLLVRAGLNDTQVGYWEPAKWVAKLRKMKTDNNLILFKTEMAAGHQGKNGRYNRLATLAFEDAFLLDLEKAEKVPVDFSPRAALRKYGAHEKKGADHSLPPSRQEGVAPAAK